MGVHLHMGLCMHMLHLGQHLHGTVCLCGAGCALARGRGLAQGCARLHSTVGDAQEHKLAQKRACTKAERGFAHRSVLAQGPCAHHAWHERVCTGLCVLAQGCAPPGDHAPSHGSCTCPLHEALHKGWLTQARHTPSPGTGHLRKVPCTRLPLHKRGSWALVTRCSQEVRVPLHRLTRALHRALCSSVWVCVITGACKPLARGCDLTACTPRGACWAGPLHWGVHTLGTSAHGRACAPRTRLHAQQARGHGGGGACALCTRVQAP